MTIKEFEKNISKKYKVDKIEKFSDLRNYLTHSDSYPTFTPFEVSEGFMEDSDFYAAYIFDEKDIAKREINSTMDSGWNTTIVFASSVDGVHIEDYFVHTSNGLTDKEYRKFLSYIDDLIIPPEKKIVY